MPSELILRVLETGQERFLSSDVVSQSSLDSLEPSLAEALENDLPVSIRGRFWIQGGFWFRAKVENSRMQARVWHSDEASEMVLIAMTVSRTSADGMPLVEVSLAGMRSTVVAREMTLELGDLVSQIAWCWLLRCVN